MADLPTILFKSPADFETWLAEHHQQPDGFWLKIAKKGSGEQSATYAEALDVALCYGWIDGQKQKFDDKFFLQKFTPRRKNSPWSKINREKVAKLIEQGRMQPAGLAEIERAKEDGRWDRAYASQSTITVPDDFQQALDQNPNAKAFFDSLSNSNRYPFLYRITTAKKPETRQNRIEKFIAMLNAGEKL